MYKAPGELLIHFDFSGSCLQRWRAHHVQDRFDSSGIGRDHCWRHLQNLSHSDSSQPALLTFLDQRLLLGSQLGSELSLDSAMRMFASSD